MKRTVILVLAIFCFTISFSQTINKEVIDDRGKAKLLGVINKEDLTKASYNEWFLKNHDDYLVNEKVVKKFKDSLKDYDIKVFLGTWCGDSKREVPRFYKILEEVNFPENQLQVIAVDKTPEAYKQSPTREEKGLNIHRVPTFIFYKDGKEVNRIVEHPKETLERDMLNIVTKNKYTPNYRVVSYLNKLIQDKGIDSLQVTEKELVSTLAEFTKGSRELNTFGYKLLRSDQIEKALYVFDLNTKIYPYKYNVYDSLGEAYLVAENYSEALKNYYKVLTMNPENKNAKEMIRTINSKIKGLE